MTMHHPALTTAPPTLVFVAHDTELLRLIATPSPQILPGEYVTLYDVTGPARGATYRVQRLQHRLPTHGALPPGATFPVAAWEIAVHLVLAEQAAADALNRRRSMAELQAQLDDLIQRQEALLAKPLPLAPPSPPDPGGPTL